MLKTPKSLFWILILLGGLIFGGITLVDSYQLPLSGTLQVSGTFGELRPDHFHSGLDLKTGGEEGKPVYAMNEGYVYRIKVSPYGLGNALFIHHPNGMYSVYGHLSKFNDEIQALVYQKQFVFKKFEQEIYLPANQIQVKKGDVIAYSGNTGNSFGPHVHFEIRDENNRAMDPLRFFPTSVADHIPPIILRIGIEPLGWGSLVNGKAEKHEIILEGKGPEYWIPETIFVNGTFGIEYQGHDRADETLNKLGINFSKLFLDDSLRFEFALEHFEFSDRKFINVHTDYSRHYETGYRFERCYIENGNELDAYPQTGLSPRINLSDSTLHYFRIEFRDRAGNLSVVRGKFQQKKPEEITVGVNEGKSSYLVMGVRRQQLIIHLKNPLKQHLNGLLLEFGNGESETIFPAYSAPAELVFLYDLSAGKIPVSVQDPISLKREKTHLTELIYPFRNTLVEQVGIKVFFSFKSVFDTLPLILKEAGKYRNGFSPLFQVGDERIPLFKSFILNIQPEPGTSPDYLVIGRKIGLDKWEYAGGQKAEDGSITASVGRFGKFCLLRDANPPSVSSGNFTNGAKVASGQKNISIKISDDFSGIHPGKILLTLDGNWVLAAFDAKSGSLFWEWTSRPAAGKHSLSLTVYDRAGNMSQQNFTLIF